MITTSYGTVTNYLTLSANLGQYCEEAFGSEGPGGYDLDGIENDFRAAINDALPPSVSLNGNEFYGPYNDADEDFNGYPLTEDGGLDITAIIEGIDFWKIAERHFIGN